jgi:hypothetical protein
VIAIDVNTHHKNFLTAVSDGEKGAVMEKNDLLIDCKRRNFCTVINLHNPAVYVHISSMSHLYAKSRQFLACINL